MQHSGASFSMRPHVILCASGPLIVWCSMMQMGTLAAVKAWSRIASGVPVKLVWQKTPMSIVFSLWPCFSAGSIMQVIT